MDRVTLENAGCGAAMQGHYVADCEAGSGNCEQAQQSPLFLVALVAVTGLGPFAMSSFIPALPAIQFDFQISTATSQLTLSVSLIAMAVSALFYGSLADRFGRRPVMMTGVSLAIVGSLLAATGSGIGVVIAGRALQAAGSTAGFVLARVVVNDVYGPQRATRILAFITAAMTIAPLLGPVVGGYLIEWLGWRSVFVCIAALAAVILPVLYLRLPETRPSQTSTAAPVLQPTMFRQLLQRPGYRSYLLFGAAQQATFMAFLAGAPFLISDYYRLPATAYGWYFSGVPVGFFVGSLIAGACSDKISNATMVRAGAALAVLACAAAVLLTQTFASSPWAVFAPAAIIGLAHGAALPAAQVLLMDSAEPDTGVGSGLFSFVQLLAGAATVQVVGMLFYLGPVAVTGIMLAAAVLSLLALSGAGGKRASAPTNRPELTTH